MTAAPHSPFSLPRRIVLTGATGFVGQAVLLALLERTDDVEVLAVVRPKAGADPRARLDDLLTKSSFAGWVSARGEEAARAEFARRVTALPSDLADLDRHEEAVELIGSAPVFAAIHCASAVSFDLGLDEEFDTNVGGALGLYRALSKAGVDPHVVHVSTAYVGGSARGLRVEGSLTHTVDWRTEMEWAHAARREAELSSRTAESLRRHVRLATLAHGKEGPNAVAAAAEAARLAWVDEQMRQQGKLRANSLGWTDVYTFTKAMSERVAETEWAGAGHRLSVVRPSIIESSAAWPYPGWLDGYKVADPLIMAYGRGLLPEIPALPDSLLDVIPVDMVVGVIVSLALGETERRGDDAYYQVVSGSSNPLPFHTMVDAVRDYFTQHPLTNDKGAPISLKRWTYRRGHLVEPTIAAQQKAVDAVAAAVGFVGRRPGRRLASTLHRTTAGLARLGKFVDLYKNYTTSELVFDDAHTRALWAEVAGRPTTIDFDVTRVDWRPYFTEHHLPELVSLTASYSAEKARKDAARASLAGAPVVARAPEASTVVAIFDLDGTVTSNSLVQQDLRLAAALGGRLRQASRAAALLAGAPRLLREERRSRARFLRAFARSYAGIPLAELDAAARGEYASWLRAAVRPGARARIEEHRAAGHKTILVTGVPAPLVAPLADLFDEVVASELEARDGVLTGYLAGPPNVDESRAAWIGRFAAREGVDLEASYGYGDSQADVTWLARVGHPFAVDPDVGLHAEAKRRRWPILAW